MFINHPLGFIWHPLQGAGLWSAAFFQKFHEISWDRGLSGFVFTNKGEPSAKHKKSRQKLEKPDASAPQNELLEAENDSSLKDLEADFGFWFSGFEALISGGESLLFTLPETNFFTPENGPFSPKRKFHHYLDEQYWQYGSEIRYQLRLVVYPIISEFQKHPTTQHVSRSVEAGPLDFEPEALEAEYTSPSLWKVQWDPVWGNQRDFPKITMHCLGW